MRLLGMSFLSGRVAAGQRAAAQCQSLYHSLVLLHDQVLQAVRVWAVCGVRSLSLCDIFFNVFLLHPAQALDLLVVRLFSYCSNNDFLFRLAGATFTYDERFASRSGPKAQTAQGARTSPAAKADRLGREEPTAIAKKRV